jgi:hypothetical protein
MRGTRAEAIRRLRLGDIKKVLRSRYGHILPDDDAGRADLELLLDVVSFVPDSGNRMKYQIEIWAPWMGAQESFHLIAAVQRKPDYLRKITAADLGAKLNLTWNERQKLSIRTISAVGLTQEFAERRKERRREKARDRKARQRRKAGAKSRIAYRSTALAHLKPWERQGISRATWYRRRETVRKTSASRNKLLDSSVTNLSQVSVERERNSRKRVAG